MISLLHRCSSPLLRRSVMEIIQESSRVVNPEAHPLTGTSVPLTIFDRAAFDLFVPVIYAFRPPTPENRTLIVALRAALAHFPHLAGRFERRDGRPCIVLDGTGVRVVEASAPSTLESHLPLRPSSPELASLYPDPDALRELFHVQFTRFSCGGLALGITCHHRVCDGQSVNMFLFQWANLVRGGGITLAPYHDRSAVAAPRSPPFFEFDHQSIEFKKEKTPPAALPKPANSAVANLVVHFPAEFIAKLKSRATENGNVGRCTTFQSLLTHLWKKITAARGVPADEFTGVRVAVSGRTRLRPRVPMEYFGNLVLWAHPTMKVGELLASSYGEVVTVIQESVAKVDNRYFKSFIDFGELRKEEEEELAATAPEPGSSLCPNLEVDSWLSFSFDELDFGGGKPCAFLPPNLPVEGLMLFVPAAGGGVDVFLALMEEHVEAFNQTSHCID